MAAVKPDAGPFPAAIADDSMPPIVQLTPEEAWTHFDGIARARLGMSGDEFLQCLDAGEGVDIVDDPTDHPWIGYLAQIRPRAR